MDYYLYKNDQNIGPLPEREVIGGLRNGRFLANDLGCRVGESEWKDLSFFFPLDTTPEPLHNLLLPQAKNTQPLKPVYPQPTQNIQPQTVILPPHSAHRGGGMSDVGKIMMFESGKKSATTAFLLCLFLGGLGVHRFYLGRTGSGAAMLIMWFCSLVLMLVFIGFLTIWITPIWAFIDLFLISGMTRRYNEDLALKMGVFN
jgi:TM2 domain-containing membrane protein YozV